MSEFEAYHIALKEYKNNAISGQNNSKSPNSPVRIESVPICSHDNIINERGINVCIDCGEEINQKITREKEWRYYGPGDNKHSSDPNRVQMRKPEERSIYKDVEGLGFAESIIAIANKIYMKVTKGQILRGDSRKAIVFACIYHAYKLAGIPQDHDTLLRTFQLSKKTGLQGLKKVNLSAPKELKIRTTYVTPVNLLGNIMEKFSATPEQKEEVARLYERVRNRSSRLNRSRPQSIASSIVFYWIQLKGKDISLKEFAKKVQLSELTINKLAKVIGDILNGTNVEP